MAAARKKDTMWRHPDGGHYRAGAKPQVIDFGRPVLDVVPIMTKGDVRSTDYSEAHEGRVGVTFATMTHVRAWHVYGPPKAPVPKSTGGAK